MQNNSRKVIRIQVMLEPTAKGRARTAYVHGIVMSYTPEKTRLAQEELQLKIMRHQDQCFAAHIPVKLSLTFYRTKNSTTKRYKEMLPVRKPDLDNFIKLSIDSLNGVLVKDDSQITAILARKRWSDKDYGYLLIRLEEDTA